MTWKQKSIGLYIIALLTPMFWGDMGWIGLFGLFLGWMGLLDFDPYIGIPWLTNILYFATLFIRKLSTKTKLILIILSILFALFAIGITEVPRDEGGGKTTVTFGVGFVMWVASFVCILIAQVKRLKNDF